MIGTSLIETLVQAVALSHLVKGHQRVSLLLLAAPESGKTTITKSAECKHVQPIAVISGRSVIREMKEQKHVEYLLFNDMSAIRGMSVPAVNLLVSILNQVTQGERGLIAFAGKEREFIDRQVGIIACIPFTAFKDNRSRWREMGFVSRMIPFAYSYPADLVATIKDSIDEEAHANNTKKMPKARRAPVRISVPRPLVRRVRHLADARAHEMGLLGIRLLNNYHCLIRAHALLHGRSVVAQDDLKFLREVDKYVSVQTCTPLALNGQG